MVLAAILAVLAAGTAPAGEGPGPGQPAPVWPLDLPGHYLTSNFMEYRPGRFHAGLDFKTQSESGFPVRAVEDGWIARVRATPGAYGRAIYLQGESGRTYVYAHLERFNDVIEAALEPVRRASGIYRAAREFAPGEMPVRAGQVLALSGQSGTLGPHLHFEVRDAAQRPLDPQDWGFAVADTFPPVIRRLRAIPASPDARVAGAGEAAVLERADFGGGERAVLNMRGPVAFTAKVTEQADIRGHVLEPSRLEVVFDGRTVYRSRNERFSFDEVGLQRLEWLDLPAQGERPAIRERWLHRRPQDALAGREGQAWYLGADGSGPEPGDHELRVVATDHAGNRDEVRLAVRVFATADEPSSAATAWRTEALAVCLDDTISDPANCLRPLVENELELLPGVVERRFAPESGDAVLAPVRVLSRWSPLGEDQIERARAQGLEGVGPQLEIAAADWPLDGALVYEIDGDAGAPQAGQVYTWDGQEWDYAGGLLQAATEGGAPRLGVADRRPHAVLRDHVPPRFPPAAGEIAADGTRRLVFGPGKASPDPAVTLPRWEILPVALVDDGAGVDAASIEAELDGRRLIVEPDLLRDRILVELPDTCRSGPYRLQVSAADEAGNRTEARWEVRCRDER